MKKYLGKISLLVIIGIFFLPGIITHSYLFSRPYKASMALSDSPYEIEIDMKSNHLFLAEYKKRLIIKKNNHSIIAKDFSFDTGGLSRVNIYQLTPTEYLIKDSFSNARFDTQTESFQIAENALSIIKDKGEFIGSFDFYYYDNRHLPNPSKNAYEEQNWRFIPDEERVELPLSY